MRKFFSVILCIPAILFVLAMPAYGATLLTGYNARGCGGVPVVLVIAQDSPNGFTDCRGSFLGNSGEYTNSVKIGEHCFNLVNRAYSGSDVCVRVNRPYFFNL